MRIGIDISTTTNRTDMSIFAKGFPGAKLQVDFAVVFVIVSVPNKAHHGYNVAASTHHRYNVAASTDSHDKRRQNPRVCPVSYCCNSMVPPYPLQPVDKQDANVRTLTSCVIV